MPQANAPHNPAPDARRRALGRGLESLLPSRPQPVASLQAEADPEIKGVPLEVEVDRIDRNPYQTRTGFDPEKLKELAASVASSGVVQPLVVRPGKDGRYTLITGERRLLASRQAGRATVPVIVREVSELQAMEMTVVENLQRADLNPMEQARAYERLSREFHLTQEQMAERTGKDRASVANFVRLLRLPSDVQALVEAGELTFGHARTLLALPNAETMITVAHKVVADALSVRTTEGLVQAAIHPDDKVSDPKPAKAVDPNVREMQEQLRRRLGLKVTIHDRKGKGRVVIEYSGLEDFDALMHVLGEDS